METSERGVATRLVFDFSRRCESVDGIVSEFGGAAQEAAAAALPVVGGDDAYPIRCATGDAVRVPARGGLANVFDALVLAVPPFWTGDTPADWRRARVERGRSARNFRAAASDSRRRRGLLSRRRRGCRVDIPWR